MSQTIQVSIDPVNNLKMAVLSLIETDGIEAAKENYLGASMDWNTRKLAHEIFGNLEQDTITGEWSFRGE